MLLALLLACAPDYLLSAWHGAEPPAATGAPATGATTAPTAAAQRARPAFTPVSVEDDGGSAVAAEVDSSGRVRRERFVLGDGVDTAVADFLFVVDNSASMNRILDRVRGAFATLAEAGAFPAEARIAVMSTLPADPEALGRAHPAVRHRGRNRLDPGFLRLVDAASILRFREGADEAARARFPARGCGTAWFRPGERDADGVPCIVAHTQIAMDAVGVEAGLTAFGQLVEARGDRPLFRPGAAANVIFVSDTQDPGLGADAAWLGPLVAARPTAESLGALVDAANTVASFRLHAIAPEHDCGEPWAHLGPVYQDAARASGGRTLDVCTAEDYRGLIADIAREGAVVQRPVVALARPLEDAVVEVDGQPVGWSASADGRAVVLDTELGPERRAVTVTYRVKAAPKGR